MTRVMLKAVSFMAVAAGVVGCDPDAPKGDGLVADPFRAVSVKWPKHVCKGQDYRFLLYPSFFALEKEFPELAKEAYFRDAGWASVGIEETYSGGGRVLSIREIVCKNAKGKDVKARARMTSPDRAAAVEDPAFLTDGNLKTCGIVSAPIYDPQEKYRSVHAEITLEADEPIASVRVVSSNAKGIQASDIKVVGAEATYAAHDVCRDAKLAVAAKKVVLAVTGEKFCYRVGKLKVDDKLRMRLKDVPFYIDSPGRGMFGLRPDCIDLAGYEQAVRDYSDTYLGSDFGEWDAMFLYRLGRPWSERLNELAQLGAFPCGRDRMVGNLKAFWDLTHSQKGARMFGMCAAGLQSYACEFGSTLCCAEFTDNREKAFRNLMMRMRGASRQFNVPIYVYTAYFRNQYTCDSRPERNKSTQGRWGEDYGREPSLSRREHFMTYYMGNNYQSFECIPWGQVKKLPDGTLGYTKNGLAMKEIYDWYKSPKGDRGESYAPILMLSDRAALKDNLDWMHVSEKHGTGPFKCSYPPTDADFLEEYVMKAITPYYDPYACSPTGFTPDFSANMRNSTLGDIFDFYAATTLTPGKGVTYGQLVKYPVVFLLNDIQWSIELANAIKKYVANGGTLVLTSAQAAPYANDPSFLGLTPTGSNTEDDNLVVEKVALAKARVVDRTTSGLPLVTVNRFECGNVVFVTSPFFRQVKDRDTVPPKLLALLERLQRETVPVRVEGSCEAMYNVCADGSWRVILINNAGVQKDPSTSDDPSRPEWATKLVVTLPKGATAEEIRTGAALEEVEKIGGGGERKFNIVVPAGEIYVLKVDGLAGFGPRRICTRGVKGVTPFESKPYVAKIPYDGYKYPKPDLSCGGKRPPAVIGEWKASNGMKDSSGNGHDMKLQNGAKVENGVFVTGEDLAYGEVLFRNDYPVDEATFDMYVTPEKDVKKAGVFQKDSQCMVSDVYRIEIRDGRWVAECFDESRRRNHVVGPVAEPRRTRLTLTFKDGFLRFYVDGREYKNPVMGPLKTNVSRQARDNFYSQVILQFGASHIHPGGFFKGTCESLTFLSKALFQ